MNRFKHPKYGNTTEVFLYTFFALAILWVVYWGATLWPLEAHTYGILPGTVEGLKGILLAPLLHSARDIGHILNNSLPFAILFATLLYFYREIAWWVLLWSWIGSGAFVWIIAENHGAYHIGISGVIYALAAFLFLSGTLRQFRPLQGISLFVAFLYGSMVWGIFPMKISVSWEGHLGGFLVGLLLAVIYRKRGPQRPKYQYEIEQEMGIPPPDFEGEYLAAIEHWKEQERLRQEATQINYHYVTKDENEEGTTQEAKN